MFAKIRLFTPVLLLAFVLTSCQSAQKFVESGDYDGAIEFCVRKLRGKSKKKTELVQGLEAAFRKAQARDKNTIDHLIADGRPENWERINDIYRDMAARQRK